MEVITKWKVEADAGGSMKHFNFNLRLPKCLYNKLWRLNNYFDKKQQQKKKNSTTNFLFKSTEPSSYI